MLETSFYKSLSWNMCTVRVLDLRCCWKLSRDGSLSQFLIHLPVHVLFV